MDDLRPAGAQLQVQLLLRAVNWNSSKLHLLATVGMTGKDLLGPTLMVDTTQRRC